MSSGLRFREARRSGQNSRAQDRPTLHSPSLDIPMRPYRMKASNLFPGDESKMASARKAEETVFKFAGLFLLAYISCAIHDDWRIRRGEHDQCVLPALKAALGSVFGL